MHVPIQSPPPPRTHTGVLKLESDLTQLKLQRAHQDAAIKARERDVERLSKAVEGLKAELHEANAK